MELCIPFIVPRMVSSVDRMEAMSALFCVVAFCSWDRMKSSCSCMVLA